MRNRILSFILALCMAVSIVGTIPIIVSAEEYSGTCGENVTWELDTETGVLTISGTGAMTDYTSSNAPWHNYKNDIKSVTISDGVTSVGSYAFFTCNGVTNIAIPDSVTRIGKWAFAGCWSLTSVTIPGRVTSIGDSAFKSCDSLTSVTIPDSLTSIGDSAFYDCSQLTEIVVDENNAYYCSVDGVLFNKGKTTLIQYPTGKTDTTYTIPDSVTSIGNYAFSSCDGLTSVTIGGRVTSIGRFAFERCTGLTSVTIGDSVTSIGDGAFCVCQSLTSVTIGDGVTSIGNSAFYYCNSLTDVYYRGSEDEWESINIDSNYNSPLTNATIHYNWDEGSDTEEKDEIILGVDNNDGTYSLPENVLGYYIDDTFVDAGKFDVAGGEVITTVYFNVTMVNGAQVRYGGGLDENGKITSGNGLRFLATVDRSNFDADSYGMKITAEGSTAETIVEADKWQDDTTFTVALTNMAESNYIRKFTATPFAKVKYDDGTEKTIYGTQTVTRSIYQVASGLLKADDEIAKELCDVLNAYANQTGIRLVVVDGELKANTSHTKNGAYELEENELHFAVSDAAYDSAGNAYSVILTAQGNAEIITDNDFWYEYIRINNNNSLIKDKVTVERVDGTADAVKVVFYADGLIERPADKNDNTTTDPGDDDFDSEGEWN